MGFQRRLAAVLSGAVMIGLLARPVAAAPDRAVKSGHEPRSTLAAAEPAVPAKAAEPEATATARRHEPWYRRHSKAVAAGAVGTIYAGVATWAYFAWFRGRDRTAWHLEHSGTFDVNSYAGGADKMGHIWATYVLSRSTSEVLRAGGWKRLPSSIAGSSLGLFFFTMSELEDAYVWGFDPYDEVANTTGALLSALMVNVPAVDRLLDYRVEYLPTSQYRKSFVDSGNVDVAQDYSGESYILALHLGELPRINRPSWMVWARYVDLVAGFETRNYMPAPTDPNAVRRQRFVSRSCGQHAGGAAERCFRSPRAGASARGCSSIWRCRIRR